MDGERFVDQIFKKKTKLVDVSDDSFFYRLRQKFDPACFPFACFYYTGKSLKKNKKIKNKLRTFL